MRRLLSTATRATTRSGQLSHRCISRVSTLGKMVADQQQELSAEHISRLQEFQSQMIKVYLFDKLTSKINRHTARKLASLGISHNKPITGILEFFEKDCRRGFDDTLLATLIQRLGQCMKSMRLDQEMKNGGEKELEEIYAHRMFDSLLDEVRYGFKKGVYMSYRNIGVVVQGLADMGYLDTELFEQAISKVERKLENTDNTLEITKGLGYNPQIERKYYYFGGDMFDRGELLKNPAFNNITNTILRWSAEDQAKKRNKEDLQNELKEIFGEESATLIEEFEKLSREVNQTRENLEKYSRAVLSLRNRYYLMLKAQMEIRTVLADPNLNLELLELEENLLRLKLISIDEVKKPELLVDKEYNITAATKIMTQNLSDGIGGNVKFIESLLKETKEPEQLPPAQSEEQELKDMLWCIVKLSEYASTPAKEVNSPGLTENKWAKQIIDNTEDAYSSKTHYLPADRIFRKRYAVLLKHFFKLVPKINQLLIEQTPRLKVFWAHTLVKLGLHEEALKVLPRLTADLLPDSPRHLFLLIETVNNLNGRVEVQTVLDNLLARLTKLCNNGELCRHKTRREDLYEEPLGLYELSTIANWLSNTHLEKQPIYMEIVNELKHRIQHARVPKFIQNYGYAAQIVKSNYPALQIPQVDASNDPYNFRTFYYNPILEIIHKAFVKYLDLPDALSSGPYLPLGFSHLSKTKSTGLFILPQAATSLEGKFIDGNVLAYINRIKKSNNIEVETLPVISFLDFDPSDPDIKLKQRDAIEPFFKSILKIEDGELFAFTTKLSSILADVAQGQLSWRNKKAVQKIARTIKHLLQLNKTEKTTFNYEVAVLTRSSIISGLSQLERDLQLLEPATFKYIEDKILKQTLERLIKNLNTILTKEYQAASKSQSQNTADFHEFFGKRQTIQMIDPPAADKAEERFVRNVELIDLEFFEDRLYNQYPSWQQSISKAYGQVNCSDLEVSQCSALTRLTLGNNPPKKFSVSPSIQPRRLLTTGYPLNWEHIYMVQDKHLDEAQEIERIANQPVVPTQAVDQIIELQNFKQELKVGGIDAIFGLLNRLDFIDELIRRVLENSALDNVGKFARPLDRIPEDYFGYLRRKSFNLIDKSPYLSYIFSKIQRQDRLKDLFEKLERTKLENRVLIEHNKLSYKQHLEDRKKIEAQILQELDRFQEELVEDKVLVGTSPTLRMFKTEIDRDDLRRFFSCIKAYSLEEDEDVILSNGDLSKALNAKREKSEHKLIQARILHRINSGQNLSEPEKDYHSSWAQGKLNFNSSFTRASLQDLSTKDKELLGDYCQIIPEAALTDLVLEFALFFDDTVLATFSQAIKSNPSSQIDATVTKTFEELGNSKANRQFLNRIEETKFDKQSRFTPEDIEGILSASKLLKTETPPLRRTYDEVYKDARSQLEQLNESPQRRALVAEWYRAKEVEFDSKYNPNEFAERKEKDAEKTWLEITGKPFTEVHAAELSGIVNTLCERMYLLKKHQPPFFKLLLIKILTHPELRTTDRNVHLRCIQNLLGTIELMKVQIDLDSHEVAKLAEAAATKQKLTSEEHLGRWIERHASSLPA